MALLTPQVVDVDGLEPVYAAADVGGDTITPRKDLVLHVQNGSAGAITVTLVRPGAQYGQPNPDVAITVDAGESRFIRVPSEFRDPDTGVISVTYSAVASVTVALLVF